MIFKLAEAAEKSWRRHDCHNQLPKLILGVKFTDRLEASQKASWEAEGKQSPGSLTSPPPGIEGSCSPHVGPADLRTAAKEVKLTEVTKLRFSRGPGRDDSLPRQSSGSYSRCCCFNRSAIRGRRCA
jgi:hypothetical protein